MFSDELAYVAIVAREPDAAAGRLSDLFGLARTDIETAQGRVPAVAVGRSAILVLPPGHALAAGRERPGVDHIAIGADDPRRAADAARALGFPTGAPTPGLRGAEAVPLAADALLGVRTVLTPPLAPAQGPPGPVSRIDHLGIASSDAFEAVTVFRDRLGLPLESMQTDVETTVAVESFTSDRYGVVHHSRPARIVGGLRVAFLTIGDCELEFLQNLDPRHGVEMDADRAGTTKQDQGAITRYVERYGPGLHHVALKTDDIDALLARAERSGVRLIDRRGRPGSRRGRIGFFHPDAFGGVLFHLVERPDA